MPEGLGAFASRGGLYGSARGARHAWRLTDKSGEVRIVAHSSRLVIEDILVLKYAVLAGLGIAKLPPSICTKDSMCVGSLT